MDPQFSENVANEAENVKEKALQATEAAQDYAQDALGAAESYIRQNPWLGVAGAVVVGAAVAALLPRPEREPDRVGAVRDWLGDTYAKVTDRLPDPDDVRSLAQSQSNRAASLLQELGKKLHLI